MYAKVILTGLIIFLVFVSSCKKITDGECPKCPRVTAVMPSSGYFGDTVLITGKFLLPDFSYDDKLEVKFNGKVLPDEYILYNSDDSIQVIIPKGTSSGPVTVDLNEEDGLISAGSANFTYLFRYTVSTFAGNGVSGSTDNADLLQAQFVGPARITSDPVSGDVYITDPIPNLPDYFKLRQLNITNGVNTLLSAEGLKDLTCGINGQLYTIQSGDLTGFQITKLLYTGSSWTLINTSSISFNAFYTIMKDGNNDFLIYEGYYLKKIVNDSIVSIIAGTGIPGFGDGPAAMAQFGAGIDLDFVNTGEIFIADYNNNRIRKLSNGVVSTIAGTGTQGFSNGDALTAELTNPQSIAADNYGNIYFTEAGRNCIRKLNLLTSEVSVVAGSSNGAFSGYIDGDPSIARFNNPTKLEFDKNKNILYIIDLDNYVIRQLSLE